MDVHAQTLGNVSLKIVEKMEFAKVSPNQRIVTKTQIAMQSTFVKNNLCGPGLPSAQNLELLMSSVSVIMSVNCITFAGIVHRDP
jgi:hypothetical protein